LYAKPFHQFPCSDHLPLQNHPAAGGAPLK
jgi:hypothetical protein